MELLPGVCQRLQNRDASLSLLNLSCKGIGNEGVLKLARSCSASQEWSDRGQHSSSSASPSPLVVLWLENNEIHSKGATALSQVLDASPHLKYLYLAHNSINNSGAAVLARKALTQLLVCNMAENSIGSMGGRVLADGLADKLCTVKTLILDSNHLRDDGAIFIAEKLKDNSSLQDLDLQYNHITVKGIRALRDALVHDNKTLLQLRLEDEPYNKDCQRGSQTTLNAAKNRGRVHKYPRLCEQLMQSRTCSCECCNLRKDIEYYLALNRAGRHSFGNVGLPSSLWPRIMGRVSNDDPSLLFAILIERPDIVKWCGSCIICSQICRYVCATTFKP